MTIVNSSANLTAKDIYALCMNPKTQKMKDFKDVRIPIQNWAIFEDVDKKTGELHEILSIQTPDGEVYATNSTTFKDDFLNMLDLFVSMGETVPAILVISGTSKAGREFITCVYSD